MRKPSSSRSVRTLAMDLRRGGRVPSHQHTWDQLVLAVSGIMSVSTDEGSWVVPPQRAVWVPAAVRHFVEAPGALAMRTVYFPPGRVGSLPRRCCVVGVPPLLREVILHLVQHGDKSRPAGRKRLEAVLFDLLEELPQEPLTLPMPTDPRARRLAQFLARHPEDRRSLEQLGHEAGASARTLQRCFLSETGMSFRQWRQQLRLHRALVLLAEGHPVTSVALQVGYDSPSAFVVMFHRALGASPGRYFRT